MVLLELDGGKAGLELGAVDMPRVLRHLEQFGRVAVERRATHEVIRVAGHSFVYVNDWDELCLISADAGGSTILAEIAADDAGADALRA